MKRITISMFFLCIIIAFTSCHENTKKSDIVKIACNLPMTGDVSIYGESIRNGYTLALNDLQDSLRKYNIKIVMDYQDNRGQAKEAISIMHNQIRNGFDFYVSGITQQTLAIKDIVSKCDAPHIIWSYYPLELSADDNIFRTWVNLPHEPYMFIDYLHAHKDVKKIACVYLNAASGQNLFNNIFIPMASKEYEIVYNDSFDIERANFKDIVLKIKQTNPDIIFVNGFQNHIIGLAKEFNVNKMKKDGNIVFTFDLLDAMEEISSNYLNGFVANIPNYALDKSDVKQQWESKYQSNFNRMPNYTDAYAYDCIFLIYNAIRLVQENEELSYSKALKQLDINGITGSLSFAENGNLNSCATTCIVKDGVLTPVL